MGGYFDSQSVSGRVRETGAGKRLFLSDTYVAAVGDHAFILAATHLAATCRAYTVDNWIDLWVKKKGSEYSFKSTTELKNHWVCLG